MLAANREQIKITGAIFMELTAKDAQGKVHDGIYQPMY